MEGGSARGGAVTRSFLLTREARLRGLAGGGARGGEGRVQLRAPCIPVRAGAQTADSERPILRVGPLVIDPVFSSAWARLITFQTPLPFTTDEGANNNLEFLVWASAKSQPKRRFVS